MNQHVILPELGWRWFRLVAVVVGATWCARHYPLRWNDGFGADKALWFQGALFFGALVLAALLVMRTRWWFGKALWGWLCVSLGWWAWQSERLAVPIWQAEDCRAEAYLTEFPREADPIGKRFGLYLAAHDCALPQGFRVFAYDYRAGESLHYGQAYRLDLRLKPTDWGGIATVQADAQSALSVPFYQIWRSKLHAAMQPIDERWRGWLRALLLGDQSALRFEEREMLKRTGTSHLIAVSGFHLVLVAGFGWLLLRPLSTLLLRHQSVTPQTMTLLLNLIWCGAYALLSGAEPPVVRAWLMLLMLTLFWLRPIATTALQTLGAVLVIQLFVFPEDLWNIGAWLSYFAVLTLVLIHPHVRGKRHYWQFVVVQSALTLVMMPVIWALFGGISAGAWLVNLVLIPYTGALMLLGALAWLWSGLVPLLNAASGYYFGFLERSSRWDWVYFEPAWQPTVLMGVCVSALLLLGLSHLPRKALWGLGLMVLALGDWARLSSETWWLNHRYRVGIVQTEQGVVIINSGTKSKRTGRDDAARQLLPYLRRRGLVPSALLVTERAVAANSAVVSLKTAYPDLPIYRFVSLDGFAYPSIDCTKSALLSDCKPFRELLAQQSALSP